MIVRLCVNTGSVVILIFLCVGNTCCGRAVVVSVFLSVDSSTSTIKCCSLILIICLGFGKKLEVYVLRKSFDGNCSLFFFTVSIQLLISRLFLLIFIILNSLCAFSMTSFVDV